MDEIVLPKIARAAERVALSTRRRVRARRSLAVVVVAWDTDRTRHCLRMASDVFEAWDGEITCEQVVVANRSPAADGLRTSISVVDGNNDAFEFGGYDDGLAWFDRNAHRPDCYLVMNDRALVHEPNVLSRLTPEIVDLASRVGVVGEIDTFLDGNCHEVMGRRIRSWARSSAMLISAQARERVGSLVSVGLDALEQHVPSSFPGGGFRLADCGWLDAEYARFIDTWLTGRGRFRSHWYGATPLTEASWPTYRRKVFAILNEHAWSVRCYERGLPVVPIGPAEILGAFAPDSRVLTSVLNDLARDPVREHRAIGSWKGRIDLARRLAGEGRPRNLAAVPPDCEADIGEEPFLPMQPGGNRLFTEGG